MKLLPLAVLLPLPFTAVRAAETIFYREVGPGTPFHGMTSEDFYAPVLADMDGDGDADLLFATSDDDNDNEWLEFFRNTGTAATPVFTAESWAALGSVIVQTGDHLCVADLDADGDNDISVISSGGMMSYYRNTGTAAAPVFTLQAGAASPFPAGGVGASSPRITAGDVDADGDIDMVISDNGVGNLALLRNTGTSAVPAFLRQDIPPFSDITSEDDAFLSPALTDSDGDGDLDLVVGLDDDAPTGERIAFYRNTGTAAAPAYTLDPAPLPYRQAGGTVRPTVADLNADGHPDLLCGIFESRPLLMRGAPPQPARYTELTGAAHPVPSASLRAESGTADLDNDGDEDLAVSDGGARNLLFLRNTGTDTAPAWTAWGGASPAPAVSGVRHIRFADLDADDDHDLILQSATGLRYFRNNGTAADPVFAELTGANNPFAAVPSGNSPALADIDGDADLDLATGYLYYENTGTRFAAVFTQRTGAANPMPDLLWTSVSSPELADLDGDGDADLIVADGGDLLYYENTGGSPLFIHRTGPSSPFAAFNGASSITGIRVGEWKDGAPTDLMFTVVNGPAPVGIRFFTGVRPPGLSYVEWAVMNFGSPPPPLNPTNFAALPVADPDGDGHQNLVEYALDTDPTQTSELPCTAARTPEGLLQVQVNVRSGDPELQALHAFGQSGTNLTNWSGNYTPEVSDPVPGDGFVRWTFTDEPPPGENPRRFLRAVFEVN